MRVAVQKIEGVDSVVVSLEQGLVVARFRPESRATLEQVREAIRRNGFTPKAAEVRLRGTVVRSGGQLGLAIPGETTPYRLRIPADSAALAGRLDRVPPDQPVVVEGTVPEAGKLETGRLIEVKRIRERPGG